MASAGRDLRERLGLERTTEAATQASRAAFPANIDATRLYAEGLARLRELDAVRAQELLEKAAAPRAVKPDDPHGAGVGVDRAWLRSPRDGVARNAPSTPRRASAAKSSSMSKATCIARSATGRKPSRCIARCRGSSPTTSSTDCAWRKRKRPAASTRTRWPRSRPCAHRCPSPIRASTSSSPWRRRRCRTIHGSWRRSNALASTPTHTACAC